MIEFGGVVWPIMHDTDSQQTDWYDQWYAQQTWIAKSLTESLMAAMERGESIETTAKQAQGIAEWFSMLESKIKSVSEMKEKDLQEWAREELGH